MTCQHCLSTSIFKKTAPHFTKTIRPSPVALANVASTNVAPHPFNDLQFLTDVVLLAVLWCLRYKLGFRDVAALSSDRTL